MPKFRKKPVVIEAVQWEKGMLIPVDSNLRIDKEGSLLIQTLEGTMKANPGDWVITGVKGEVYPCKSDIFEATYEAVDG